MDENPHYVQDAHSQVEEISANEENQDVEEITELEGTDTEHTTVELAAGTPHIGMQFSTDEEAYEYYNAYAKRKGFGVRKHTSARKDGEFVRRHFVCYKQGYKSLNDKREAGRDVKRRKTLEREGCKARFVVYRIEEGVWELKFFDDEHNHELLITVTKILTLKSHRKFHKDPPCKASVHQFHSVGSGQSRTVGLVNSASENNSMNITPPKCVEIERERKESNIGRKCMNMIKQFLQRHVADFSFYHAVEIDGESVCRSIFWADGRARTSYMQFSDVVVVDVRYKTNKFRLPFTPITGVNHHNRSTLFGCALLADEKEETFVWLFENLLNCMGGKAPGAIITDQDPAICSAVKRVFPNTHHRYCMWHVGLHEDEHLCALRSAYNPSFDADYKRWVRKTQSIEEAESCWLSLKEKYKKEFKEPSTQKQKSESKAWKWLEHMYEKRNHWIEAYLKDTFSAGMCSSQRSEGMNSFFDGFVNSMTPLDDFINQYDNALASRREKEEREDTFCLRTKLDFQGMHDIEAYAGRVYTRKIFNKFQEEFRSGLLCRHEKVGTEGCFTIYNVSSKVDNNVSIHTVKCNVVDEMYLCSCSMFKTVGILCKHILYIMKQKSDLQSIPSQYVLGRWTLDARHCTTTLGSLVVTGVNEGKTTPLESWSFRTSVWDMVEKVDENKAFYEIGLNCLKDFWKKCNLVEEELQKSNSEQSTNVRSISPNIIRSFPEHIAMYDPKKNSGKRQPLKASRVCSGIQTAQAQTRRGTNSCGNCNQKGHDIRTCKGAKSLEGPTLD